MIVGVDASRALRPLRTGTENYSLHLIRALLATGSGESFRLYADRPLPATVLPAVPGAEVRVLHSRYLWTHLRLGVELVRSRPDVLFVPAHVLPIYRGCPSVVTIHDLGYLASPDAHPPLARLYLNLGTWFSARVATRVIAVSSATKNDLVARLHVPPEKIDVVPEAASPEYLPLADREAGFAVARRLGVQPPYVLALGSVHPRKNLRRLVEAFLRARREASLPQRLVIAGGLGYRANEVAECVRRQGGQEAVVMTGYVGQADLPLLLGAADALVFPSLYEGFGLPALEAMACAVPVLASNTTSLPEVVGDAGVLFDPFDVGAMAAAIAGVLANPALRAELAARGLARARLFTWERAAIETLAVLRRAALG